MRKSLCLVISLILIGGAAGPVKAGVVDAGRHLSNKDKEFSISLTFGRILSIDGSVRETKRAGEQEEADRSDSYYDKLEDYSLEELGFDDSYGTLGLNFEKQWKYFTLQTEFLYTEASASGKAEREPFAIGVGEVTYEGKEYDYMLIPEGESYDADVQGTVIQLKGLITPLHVNIDEGLSFTPWLHIGLFSVLGFYEIDAGEPQGVTTYESHPHQYVIGGKGEGWAGLVIPDIGFGGEVKMTVGKMKHGDVKLALQADFALLDWAGSTSDIGASSRNEKDVGLDYMAQELRAVLELPVSKNTDVIFGLNYQHVEADADVEAKDRTDEEREERLEKYDKKIDFEMNTFYAFIGLRF